MIGKLKGIVDYIAKDHIILDVGGVGYIVFCSSLTLNKITQLGDNLSLLIEMHVREDSMSLYGFFEPEERLWFKTLITIKGVGTKLALGILSVLNPAVIANAIIAGDKAAFKQISGVGLKLAERILTELKSSEHLKSTNLALPTLDETSAIMPDAISALTNLGYSRLDAHNMVHKVLATNPKASLGELIKISLKELS
jgi:Holliday junction DNA helicase RuvA